MPKLIPMHSVILSRPNKDKRKDKEGNIIHERVVPPLGKAFEFTDEEVEHLKASGHTFRTASASPEKDKLTAEEEAEMARIEAEDAEAAMSAGHGAKGDAAVTSKSLAEPKPPVEKSGTTPNLGNEQQHNDDADEL